jgi:hypothetical protein
MATKRVIVSEVSGRWSLALRLAFAKVDVSITEGVESVDAFSRLHDDTHQALLALEVTPANAEDVFRRLQQNREGGVLILLDEELEPSEALWREAGAITVVKSSRHLAPVARLVRRYFELQRTPPQTFQDKIWQRIPWSQLTHF